jgi:hypothetical protein
VQVYALTSSQSLDETFDLFVTLEAAEAALRAGRSGSPL